MNEDTIKPTLEEVAFMEQYLDALLHLGVTAETTLFYGVYCIEFTWVGTGERLYIGSSCYPEYLLKMCHVAKRIALETLAAKAS